MKKVNQIVVSKGECAVLVAKHPGMNPYALLAESVVATLRNHANRAPVTATCISTLPAIDSDALHASLQPILNQLEASYVVSTDAEGEVDIAAAMRHLAQSEVAEEIVEAGAASCNGLMLLHQPHCALCHITEVLLLAGGLRKALQEALESAAVILGREVDQTHQATEEIEGALGAVKVEP